jgi:xanthine/uracil/vitamin C permease (AzgA family)
MEKLFQLKANGTTVRTELLAGLTTFMTMAYIIALNPNLLTNFAVGTPLWNGVFLATCIASAIGTICMAFLANKPFVMAPGMGQTASSPSLLPTSPSSTSASTKPPSRRRSSSFWWRASCS